MGALKIRSLRSGGRIRLRYKSRPRRAISSLEMFVYGIGVFPTSRTGRVR